MAKFAVQCMLDENVRKEAESSNSKLFEMRADEDEARSAGSVAAQLDNLELNYACLVLRNSERAMSDADGRTPI